MYGVELWTREELLRKCKERIDSLSLERTSLQETVTKFEAELNNVRTTALAAQDSAVSVAAERVIQFSTPF
ncbi:unnamed protein product [Protopolystoma xenopodis]|uniref:Uncharacterized protein n=1 Tax=Protopolystoma xenopodis TaxID=117903 RepID=A0A448X258_9PLAT|nr:unnamed protein product [Protopolystoma xenopodis]